MRKAKSKTTLKWKLIILLSLSHHFYLIHICLFSGVVLHWPLIFLPSFFLFLASRFTDHYFLLFFFLSFWVLLQIISYSVSSRGQSLNKIVTRFLSFFWRHFNPPIWAGLRKTVYSVHYRHVCLFGDLLTSWLVWFSLFADSTFPLPRITLAPWPISIQPSNR